MTSSFLLKSSLSESVDPKYIVEMQTWKKILIFSSVIIIYNCLTYGSLKWKNELLNETKQAAVTIRICCSAATCRSNNDNFSDIASMSEARKLSKSFHIEKKPIKPHCFPLEEQNSFEILEVSFRKSLENNSVFLKI